MKYLYLALILPFLFNVFELQAQVTIGSGEEPSTGSLLDLKQKMASTGEADSQKGLLLPRVKLTSLTPPTGEMAKSINNTGNWSEVKHTGLMVYNAVTTIDACIGGAHQGVYLWGGEKWIALQMTNKFKRPTTETSSDKYDGANSYLAKTNETLTIPVKRAFDIWTDFAGSDAATGKVLNVSDANLTGTLAAEVVWSDENTINSLHVLGSDKDAKIEIKTGTAEGNALVRLLAGSKVVWQWHIWISNENPIDHSVYYVVNGTTKWYMDRFLGSPNNKKSGLFYQWGRPTPFVNTGIIETIIPEITSTEQHNLTAAIQSEKFITFASTESHDWYSKTAKLWNSRWEVIDAGVSKKSAFDPCPRGWRLPPSSDKGPWECLDKTSSNAGSEGWNFDEIGREIGSFPFTGYRSNGNGSLGNQTTTGYVWTAKTEGAHAVILYYDATTINTHDKYNRANAMAVRCMKDE